MIFYTSTRVGRYGREFRMYKIRTLKEGGSGAFAHEHEYTWCGRFLRRWRLDELPQLLNMIKGDMALVGPRPEEAKQISILPEDIRNKLLSVKPGLFGLSGLYFMDEEHLLKNSTDPMSDYWTKIRPIKLTLDFFYIDNRGLLFDLWIIFQCLKVALKRK